MESLVFDDGLKTYCIGGDETKIIRFNPCDMNIYRRIEASNIKIAEFIEETSKEEDDEEHKLRKLADFICEQIDYALNSKISEVVFNGTSPLTPVNGVPYYMRFLDAIKPVIEKEIEKEKKASENRIKKYTNKYKGSK